MNSNIVKQTITLTGMLMQLSEMSEESQAQKLCAIEKKFNLSSKLAKFDVEAKEIDEDARECIKKAIENLPVEEQVVQQRGASGAAMGGAAQSDDASESPESLLIKAWLSSIETELTIQDAVDVDIKLVMPPDEHAEDVDVVALRDDMARNGEQLAKMAHVAGAFQQYARYTMCCQAIALRYVDPTYYNRNAKKIFNFKPVTLNKIMYKFANFVARNPGWLHGYVEWSSLRDMLPKLSAWVYESNKPDDQDELRFWRRVKSLWSTPVGTMPAVLSLSQVSKMSVIKKRSLVAPSRKSQAGKAPRPVVARKAPRAVVAGKAPRSAASRKRSAGKQLPARAAQPQGKRARQGSSDSSSDGSSSGSGDGSSDGSSGGSSDATRSASGSSSSSESGESASGGAASGGAAESSGSALSGLASALPLPLSEQLAEIAAAGAPESFLAASASASNSAVARALAQRQAMGVSS